MIQEGPLQDRIDATPLSEIRAITTTNARAARRVFERASLSFLLVLVGLFTVAFLHDEKMAKLGFLTSSPFVVAVVVTAFLIFRGLPTRIGAWAMLISTNVVTTIVTIMMGGLSYHSVPLLFFTLSLAAGFLSVRDAVLAALSSLAAILLIAWVAASGDPWTHIRVTGPIDIGESYLIAYLALLGAFCISAWINLDARLAQERRVIEALKRAEQAGVEKTEFFSIVSHEMRTPLNGLIGISEILVVTGSSEAVEARAKVIVKKARSLARAINRVLEMIERNAVPAEAEKEQKVYEGKWKLRGAEIAAISYALFFSNMIALLFTFDPARAHVGILASLPFAGLVWVTPVLIRRGMKWRVALRVLIWSTIGAVVVICSKMGGLAFPTAYFLLVLPGFMVSRGSAREIGAISVGCFVAILIIHYFTGYEMPAIPSSSISPPSLSWLLVAVTSLYTFVYANWASAETRMKRLSTLQAALRRAETVDEVKDFFMTGVGEQLSTSIRAIQNESKALIQEASENERKLVTTLDNSADLFSDILSTIRRYADPLPVAARQEIFEPKVLAEDVLSEYIEKSSEQRVKMDVISLFEDHAIYLGSPSEIAMILRGLVKNADKFTSIGAVRIVVGPQGLNDVIFAVEDTGSGVLPEKLERIFEGFIQGDQSAIRAHGGLGLGLAIARKRARYLGGDVTYAPRVGGGSVFTLTVPLAHVRR